MDGESVGTVLSERSEMPVKERHKEKAGEKAGKNKDKTKTFVQQEKDRERSLSKEDRLRHKAAKRIQCAYRRRLARFAAQDRFRAQYRKIYSAEFKRFVFEHKATEDTVRRLPKYFRFQDYPNPREYEAPMGYNAGNELTGEGFALVISCSEFKLGKWPELPEDTVVALHNDHENIVHALTHELYGRMRAENVISLKNPVVEEVVEAMQRLRRIARASGFVTLYLATHLTTVYQGEKKRKKKDPAQEAGTEENKNKIDRARVNSTRRQDTRQQVRERKRERQRENAYFAFRNTLWTNSAEIVESSLSLSDLADLWNTIHCREKAIVVQCALLPAPTAKGIGTTKVIYPPPDALQRLSTLCKCPVLGNCALGFPVREYARRHPGWAFIERATERDERRRAASMMLFRRRQDMDKKISPETDVAPPALPETAQPPGSLYKSTLWADLLHDWGIAPQKEIVRSPPPLPPVPQWSKPADREFQLTIELPSDQETSSYNQRYYFWRARRALVEPLNMIREGYAYYKTVTTKAPAQHCMLRDGETVFGRALIAAIRGGVSKVDSETNKLRTLFCFIYNHVQEEIALVRARRERERPRTTERNEDQVETDKKKEVDKGEGYQSKSKHAKDKDKAKEKEKDKKHKDQQASDQQATQSEANQEIPTHSLAPSEATQTPLLYAPFIVRKHDQLVDTDLLNVRVFYRCAPPPAPERPYVLKIGAHEVTLEWYNPHFEGAPPTHYRLFMRNVTRNFHDWSEVYYPTNIKSTRFVVRDLPHGIACQFKVQACNAGGWSVFSEETTFVTPGEDQTVLPDSVRWKRLQQSGAWGILDRLDQYPQHRKEQITGLKMIHGVALCNNGFSKVKLAIKVALVAFRNLETFFYDTEIIVLCFNLIGWCLQGKSERKVRALVNQRGLNDIVSERIQRYRYHTGVVAAVQWLRTGTMSKYLTELAEYKHRQLFPSEADVEQESSDEEEEEDQTAAKPVVATKDKEKAKEKR